ncbi:DUF3300 domain-containing protein [Mesorhizobium sp. ZC-5]|uniref:DUF3300 domain-containing protein n=1 Tax=Mesorhizobium sp. ZC-5 TaxID=2986066 RepID=UPI0021E7CFFB|nr:DUF3300 domain-containing protein [Mesorhizobium sp. ZC-5]MCV3241716.1 DUF3300 domain-containing protein [Mesorhizobium sp. ZC-5]
MAIAMLLVASSGSGMTAIAQEQTAAADPGAQAAQTPEPLSADELEVLVARIALYPDELVALISSASLYPLQVVEAARFLDDHAKENSLKPKESWDGSVISLLNYPEIVKMMSDDLDWTQALAEALAYQQKDVLIAIQQLREEAVAKGIIKTDDKVKVENSGDNIIIQPANPETVYVPRYEPEMLYEPNYVAAPIAYYPDPYPTYWYPTAPFFAAAVTGAIWAAAVDWDDWDVWGGHWDGGDIDIDCDHCFNNRDFNGKVKFNDVDWRNVDRSKLNIDRDQFAKFDRTNIKNRVETNRANSIGNRASEIKRNRTSNLSDRTAKAHDIRKSTLDGLKNRPGADQARARPNVPRPTVRPDGNRREAARQNVQRPASAHRPAGNPKMGHKVDHRPKQHSALGHVDRGKVARVHSNRGHHAMGGGQRGGGRAIHRGGGGRQLHHGGGHRGGGRRR